MQFQWTAWRHFTIVVGAPNSWKKRKTRILTAEQLQQIHGEPYETLPNRWHPSDHLHLDFSAESGGLDDPKAELCWHDPLRSLRMMFLGVSFCTTIMFLVGEKLITPTCIQGVKQPRSEGILNLCFLQLCCGNRYVSFGPDCIVACHRWFFLESKVRYLPWGYEVPY